MADVFTLRERLPVDRFAGLPSEFAAAAVGAVNAPHGAVRGGCHVGQAAPLEGPWHAPQSG